MVESNYNELYGVADGSGGVGCVGGVAGCIWIRIAVLTLGRFLEGLRV